MAFALTSLNVDGMLEKMQATDRDFRYMALSDLLQELQKPNFHLDAHTETRIAVQLMKMLEDKFAEVQTLAMQCLSSLLATGSEATMAKICADLMTSIVDRSPKADTKRDVSVSALKRAVPSLPLTDASAATVRKIFPQLLSAVNSSSSVEFQVECVEVIQGLATRFGGSLTHEFAALVDALLPILAADRSVLRKRSISCIGAVSVSLSDALFSRLVTFGSEKLGSKQSVDVRTSCQLLISLAVSSSHRFVPFLGDIVTKVLSQLSTEVPEPDDDVCEMLESCLLALQTFMQRCPKEMSPHIDNVVTVSLRYLRFDPNYAADSDADGGGDDDAMALDDDDDAGSGNGSDDDDDYDDGSDEYEDASWKARRASCKLMSALIYARPDRLNEVAREIVPALIKRFAEREENVKMDVFTTFMDLLRQIASLMSLSTEPQASRQLVSASSARVVTSLIAQSKHKSVKVRSGVLQVAAELVSTIESEQTWTTNPLVQQVARLWSDRNASSALKIDALVFLKAFLSHVHVTGDQKAELQAVLAKCATTMSDGVNERYFKTSIAALEVCTEFIRVLAKFSLDSETHVDRVYALALAKFASQEHDSEIKERAMTCMGAVIALFGNKLQQQQIDTATEVLLERLDNDIIRLSAVKAFLEILSSEISFDLTKVLGSLTTQLSSFLRQSSRFIKQFSIMALTQLVLHHGQHAGDEHLENSIRELSLLVSDSDVHMAGLALKLCLCVVNVQQAKVLGTVNELVVPRIVALSKSPLLQGHALEHVLNLLGALAALNTPPTTADALLSTFLSITDDEEVARSCLPNVSRCIAQLAVSASAEKCDTTVQQLAVSAADASKPSKAICSLLSIGRIGHERDLTHLGVQDQVMALFTSKQEEIKAAASFALGSIAAGNMAKMVPVLLAQIQTKSPVQYLLLHSLKEVISRQVETNDSQTSSSLTSVVPLLLEHASDEEEGVRNVVAECLGKMALLSPASVLPEMDKNISNANDAVRSTMVAALKFGLTATHSTNAHAAMLEAVPRFLALVNDNSLLVRRTTLVAFNAIVHHRSETVRLVLELVPSLLTATVIRQDLIRQVQLGPFKHTIDDGLPIRKAAWECISTVFDKAWYVLDVTEVVRHIVGGLEDDHDITLLCHHIATKVARTHSTSQALIAVLDQMCPPLTKTLTAKTKDNAVQQEIDRNQDMVRSTMRVIFAVSKLPNIETSARFATLVDTAAKTLHLQAMWKEVSSDSRLLEKRRSSSALDLTA